MVKKTCFWLNKNERSGLQIRNDGNMYACCVRWVPLSNEPSKYKDYKNLSLNDIQDLRVKIFNEINEGKHPECQSCPLLRETTDDNDTVGPIKHLIYHPHTLCSVDCNYCFYTKEQKHAPIPKGYEDVYEVIKHFYNIGLLNKEQFALDLGGGEPTLLKNIDKTVEFLSKTWEKPSFYLISNSTVTEKVNQLTESLKDKYKNVRKVLITSVDAGTEKTYEQMKGKNYYKNVVENLHTYVKNQIFNEVSLKYILLDDLSNADDDNTFGFLNLCNSLNKINDTFIKISFDIDWSSRKYNDEDIPDKILKIIGKMYYLVTEVLSIKYHFGSDYLNNTTQKGAAAVERVLMYAKEYETQEKTEEELDRINSLTNRSI